MSSQCASECTGEGARRAAGAAAFRRVKEEEHRRWLRRAVMGALSDVVAFARQLKRLCAVWLVRVWVIVSVILCVIVRVIVCARACTRVVSKNE